MHHQSALHGDEAAQAGIASFEFLHDLAVGDVGHPGAAVAAQVRAEKSQFGHLRHQVHGEGGFAVVLLDDGENFAVDKFAGRLAHQALVVVQQRINFQEIDTGKAGHVISADERQIVHPRQRLRFARFSATWAQLTVRVAPHILWAKRLLGYFEWKASCETFS